MCGERLKKSKLHYWISEKALEEALNSLREIKEIFSVWFCQFKQTFVSFSTLVYLPVVCLLGFRLCMCVSKSVCAFVFGSRQHDLISGLPKLWITFGICLDFKSNHYQFFAFFPL